VGLAVLQCACAPCAVLLRTPLERFARYLGAHRVAPLRCEIPPPVRPAVAFAGTMVCWPPPPPWRTLVVGVPVEVAGEERPLVEAVDQLRQQSTAGVSTVGDLDGLIRAERSPVVGCDGEAEWSRSTSTCAAATEEAVGEAVAVVDGAPAAAAAVVGGVARRRCVVVAEEGVAERTSPSSRLPAALGLSLRTARRQVLVR